ncbi:MAG: methyltransferase domain-containing protein [Desulfobacteraceae bacterium]|nr:class I SAM-dependent methyltransferase [Desulfobacteraceae bacterium]MBC2756725.1 methyltransferase domain-containing protein [Desulfobacteraceae bacterium]
MKPLKKQKIDQIRKPERPFTIQNHAFCFLPDDRSPSNSAGNGFLADIQGFLKRFSRTYYFLLKIFAPVMASATFKGRLKSLLERHDETKIIVNLGSGPAILSNRTDIINIDIFTFNEVDIVADAVDLPIKDHSVDVIINTAMLEHVANPETIIREMHRMLKKDGDFFCFLPFIQPFHAAPWDFHRWSIEGVRHCFQIFCQADVTIGAGPTSGMLWVVQEWLAILFSFGSRTIHDILFMLLMVITAPIKLADVLLVHFPNAEKIASGFLITGKK